MLWCCHSKEGEDDCLSAAELELRAGHGGPEMVSRVDNDPSPFEHIALQKQPEARATSAAAAAAKVSKFEATINRGTARLGLTLDVLSAGIHVMEVLQGAVERYNHSCVDEKTKIVTNTFITCVNGATTIEDMIQNLKMDQRITLQVARPRVLTVCVTKGHKPWGLNLAFQDGKSSCVEVKAVLDGAIKDFNAQATDEAMQVLELDVIECVNGVSGSSTEIMVEIKRAPVIEFQLLRFKP